MGTTGRALVAVAAALVLADASIVALALPPLLVELHTTLTGVAAVIGVYALVLALALVPAMALGRRVGVLRAGAGGLALFAAASVGCAVVSALAPLLVFRGLQAAGGAAGLLAAFAALDAGETTAGRRLWLGAGLLGTAAGPALGGALTEALDWRAIFAAGAPLAAAAAVVCARAPGAARDAPGVAGGAPEAVRGAPGPGAAAPPAGAAALPAAPARTAVALASLALTAAAFTAVLFLLVLELVAGFALSPLRAALGVSVLPLAALVAAAAGRGPAEARAAAGALLVAGGAAGLAFLPDAGLAWTLVPQALAGAGMGLALPALGGERSVAGAARGLAARHAGIVVVLVLLAPVATAQLRAGTERATLEGTALILDADSDPLDKLRLAPALLDGVDAERPRAGLRDAVAAHRSELSPGLGGRLDDVVVRAVGTAFRGAYLIAAALALVAAAALLPRTRRTGLVALAAAAAAACAVVSLGAYRTQAPPAVALRDPCLPRALPGSGGLTGALQDEALKRLDQAACKAGATREELALALADPHRAKAYERRYGADPRSASGLLSLLTG